jgi:hypothetical protein
MTIIRRGSRRPIVDSILHRYLLDALFRVPRALQFAGVDDLAGMVGVMGADVSDDGGDFGEFLSSADSTSFSKSVMTWSSCFTVSAHCLSSKLLNVSSLLPLNFASGLPCSFSRVRRFQNSR